MVCWVRACFTTKKMSTKSILVSLPSKFLTLRSVSGINLSHHQAIFFLPNKLSCLEPFGGGSEAVGSYKDAGERPHKFHHLNQMATSPKISPKLP